MPLAFIAAPALLLATIACTAALMAGAIIWARNRRKRVGRRKTEDRETR